MPNGNLAAGNRAAQVYNASGISTQQAALPQEFISNPVPASPLSGHLDVPVDHTSFVPGQPNAVVRRWPRMIGMRYLYARGMVRQPIQRLGADGQPYPHVSSFQPNNMGPTHNAGFNDALYQAGYPGWNLGLSFKVPTVDRTANQTVGRLRSASPVSIAVNRLRRPSGSPAQR